MRLYVLHYLRQDLLLHLLRVFGGQAQGGHQLPREVGGRELVLREVPVELVLYYGILVDGDVDVDGHQLLVLRQPPQSQLGPALSLPLAVLLAVDLDDERLRVLQLALVVLLDHHSIIRTLGGNQHIFNI